MYMRSSSALLAFPMHGQRKLDAEGYRTRDGHVIEWAGRLLGATGGVEVVSRPEPRLLRSARRRCTPAPGTQSTETLTWRVPDPRSRRRWWSTSSSLYPGLQHDPQDVPAVVWNPFTALAPSSANPFARGRRVVLDLLDDWSVHYAFAPIRSDVERAYRAAFETATHVTANAEGTLALAHRFGRTDAVLLPNGCDPDRFDASPTARGRTTVGYVGKIGQRLDLSGIIAVARALPEINFVFGGPVLDRSYRRPLSTEPNITLLGDVHYSNVPALLRSFDVGWVPHRVGALEVGGDIIKTYEYRAAGLPVVTTPVAGAGTRGLDGIAAAAIDQHARVIRDLADATAGPRVERQPCDVPVDATWEYKTRTVLDLAFDRATA